MLFWVSVIAFAVCMIIQFLALNRKAFGRSLFITISMFFFAGLVYIAPNAPTWLATVFYVLTWGYTLYLTAYAITRLRKK